MTTVGLQSPLGIDPLFLRAEQEAYDFELFPSSGEDKAIYQELEGLVPYSRVMAEVRRLKELDVDEYVRISVAPAESPIRPGILDVLAQSPGEVLYHREYGPLVVEERMLPFPSGLRRIGIIAQNRKVNNGVWMPEHHNQASTDLQRFADLHIPVVTFVDTPGADAGEAANCNNQAHSISRLIANFAQVCIPSIGIILGNGYSGGAIPLTTTNLILSVRDGVFNTIQPRGLANIARKYNLSWQECAKYVGVSAYELFEQGYIDGVIDYVPGEEDNIANLWNAVRTGISAIEKQAAIRIKTDDQFAAALKEHYERCIRRFSDPSPTLQAIQSQSALPFPVYPGAVANMFEITIRYLRSLSLRRRIHFTRLETYGALADVEIPSGDLANRTAAENEAIFRKWLENPFEIKYDDDLRRRWIRFADRKKDVGRKRSRVGQFFRGDPDTEWNKALHNLCIDYSFHLFNLWKDAAPNNLLFLIRYLCEMTPQPETSTPQTVIDVITRNDIYKAFIAYAQQILTFDYFYNNIIANLREIAEEGKDRNAISYKTIDQLVTRASENAVAQVTAMLPESELVTRDKDRALADFNNWLKRITSLPRKERFYKEIERWKPLVFPRIPEPLFAIITYIFNDIMPNYLRAKARNNPRLFSGRFNIKNIGIKDFWNRLEIAYHDLLIHDTLVKTKKKVASDPVPIHQKILDAYFEDFQELYGNLVSADPVKFPGFRLAIDSAIKKGITPCSAITGLAKFKYADQEVQVGLLISNNLFQAGAWDMAATEKFCKLMLECAQRKLPLVCFISSGGMNT
ncbi:MAG: carbamoyl-phosphate synthase large subunit, partial [Lentisphaerae bacterium]